MASSTIPEKASEKVVHALTFLDFNEAPYRNYHEYRGCSAESDMPYRKSSLFKGLEKLPECLRHQIYQLVVIDRDTVSRDHPTYWLNAYSDSLLNIRNIEGWTEPGVPTPSLEYKAGFFEKKFYSQKYESLRSPFCTIRHFAEALRLLDQEKENRAGATLEDFLHWVGDHIVVELETPDLNIGRAISTRLVLDTLVPFGNYITHLSLEHIPHGPRPDNHSRLYGEPDYKTKDFITLCDQVGAAMPHLQSVVFWVALSENELDIALSSPSKQPWVRACQRLGVKKVELKLLIVVVPSSNQTHPIWLPYIRARRLAWWKPKAGYQKVDAEKETKLRDILAQELIDDEP
ncbi:uncharacterized protein LY89DRAFT_671333 [Mollisia scopiformis]|uniref:Uncharacterized protein n=1 Tax=Mollisia scopiformis TaxID=149040 RepID=A0A194X560_MOLSC|nr:uncharacterized protein LY89DRAFT_671333 [Mollisia scopiformis]KUJ14937.1 hypothetical protein LY89DRAFT_671333 [Mollisia scopiformis]